MPSPSEVAARFGLGLGGADFSSHHDGDCFYRRTDPDHSGQSAERNHRKGSASASQVAAAVWLAFL